MFLGSQSLLIRCAERFVGKGHEVSAVVSEDPAAQGWADEHGIPVFEPGADLAEHLESFSFDYLFSVVHLSRVPVEVLALPRQLAINFHDGPLPAYAGLNVTSWALLNQEPRARHLVARHGRRGRSR